MQRWPIIFLVLSNLLLSFCSYKKLAKIPRQSELVINKTDLRPIIPPDGKSIKYKASIDVLNKHFTGIIVLKQTGPDTNHLVFVTELGMRMFDLEMAGDSIRPAFVFEPLNKPKLVSALVRNFRSVLLIEWYNKKVELLKDKDKEVLHLLREKRDLFVNRNEGDWVLEQRTFYKKKKETKIMYVGDYTSIRLKQYGIVKLFIELEKIKE